ncbi:alanine/glycine:cation symporter family protein [Psychromonas sp. Urea-02u-13]|uniref:alanine/glycine:cation symporter family protein n=1 Tax=Psychromonas sp. Urea-02u-13 TaxID=2058326 RepID=UPI000C33A919|nr:alanine/glycine:cation symporter family protein [Psychromonas sp. Urea-02u-13]PKG39204.1 sodium:alanine symporter family protein [Psychromonas sp. Urea-02u-13]
MLALFNSLNGVLWGQILVYLLIGTGVYFTVRLGFIQFRHFLHTFTVMRSSRKSDNEGISSFQALSTSLAARVGTGNLAGVAIAITVGGPGAIFWMWLIAVLGMATSFAESTLAQAYKVHDDDGNFRGGPAYYMERGLNARWMGSLFAIFLIIAFGLVFNAVQANSITAALHESFQFDKVMVTIGLVVVSGLVIFTGIRGIAKVAEKIVPAMALAYLLVAGFVVFANIAELPAIFKLIIDSAFGWQEASGGAFGAMVMTGIQRGLFSNEAGMGSAANAAATASPYPAHPASQGYVQMLGVFIDTIVICTATASIILLSGGLESFSGMGGIEITQRALDSQVGDWGGQFVAIALLFFAFTSLIANYSYAETNLIFLMHKHTRGVIFLRIAVLGMIVFGALQSNQVIWALADVSMGLMAIVNLIAILLLSNEVVKLAKDYNDQLSEGKVPTFDRTKIPELDKKIEPGIWEKKK